MSSRNHGQAKPDEYRLCAGSVHTTARRTEGSCHGPAPAPSTYLEKGTVGSIDSRLKRLEESRHERCPECGLAPDARRPIAVVDPDDPGEGFEGDPHETCAACGEPLYVVIRIVYDGDEAEGEGASVGREM